MWVCVASHPAGLTLYQGFFTVYRNLFTLLASDEALHTERPVIYPSFGTLEDSYAPPHGTSRAEKNAGIWARDFYTAWADFATQKKFEWVGKWDTERGSDRQIRRLMERENKRIREDYRREYNEAVRVSARLTGFQVERRQTNAQQLALFLQHRDPRYKRHQDHLRAVRAQAKRTKAAPNGNVKTKSVSAASAQQKEVVREKAAADYEEQEWQRLHLDDSSSESESEEEEVGDGTAVRKESDEGNEIFECVACNKTFMSEASWDNHERSKKHKQAVWR